MAKIQRVREWESLSESSKRFRECAAQIEAEFRAEVSQRHVRPEDLEPDDSENEDDSESEDDFQDANDSFVDDDCVSQDTATTEPQKVSEKDVTSSQPDTEAA